MGWPASRAARVALYASAKGIFNLLRTIPEIVWALLFVFMVGLGPFAGVLALGVPYLHTMAWSLPPLLVYAAVRRYLQGISLVLVTVFVFGAYFAIVDWILNLGMTRMLNYFTR